MANKLNSRTQEGMLKEFETNKEHKLNEYLEKCLLEYKEKLLGWSSDSGIAEDDSLEIQESIFVTESPVERLMYVALNHQLNSNYGHLLFMLEPQKEVECNNKKYRVDFMLTLSDSTIMKSVSFIIEVDGHDFHEKTKEQVAKDKKRERDLAYKYDGLLRFSGSEIYSDPNYFAAEALVIMRHKLYKD